MATNNNICDVCRQTSTVTHWCLECEEALCSYCIEHHKERKLTRKHKPIPISKYESLPSFITDIHRSCVDHNEIYQLYCSKHDKTLCYLCIIDHGKCGVIPLEDVNKNKIQHLELRMGDILKNIETIKNEKDSNMSTIQKYIAEVKTVRKEINKLLDKLEKDINEKKNECREKIKKITSKLNKRETETVKCRTIVDNIKQNATDLQTFEILKDIEEIITEKEQYLQTGIDNVEVVVDTGLLNIMNIVHDLKTIGTFDIKTHKRFVSQEPSTITNKLFFKCKKIDNIKLSLRKEISIRQSNITCIRGCCISPNGQFFFTDRFKCCVYQLNAVFALRNTWLIEPSLGYGIVCLDAQTVVISSGIHCFKPGLAVLNLQLQKKKTFIELPGRTYGVTKDGQSLFTCVQNQGIYEINLTDFKTTRIIRCDITSSSHIAVYADKIYYTDNNEDCDLL
ncbi:uncharacterized protein LOC134685980 [Mytilus trossulus]|uniref:uncharacterized protein LOC134685980 n=1 Tax=Mytilus trossulus TaxID=6551 RepID=UPI003005E071